MSEETLHESEEKRTKGGIASYLRRLAGRLSRNKPAPVDEDQTVTVDPPAETEMEVEVEQEGDQTTLEIELAWDDDEGDVDLDADASKARFEVYEDSAGEHRWRLVHDNGNIIADSSEGYSSKQKAEQGLDSVRENAPGAYIDDQTRDDEEVPDEGGSDATFELFTDSAEEFRWRLVHDNGEIIADGGQGYSSKQKCKQGLRSVKHNVRGARVEDVED